MPWHLGTRGPRDPPTRYDVASADGPELKRSLRALNGVNFFIADVQSGLGPFLGCT